LFLLWADLRQCLRNPSGGQHPNRKCYRVQSQVPKIPGRGENKSGKYKKINVRAVGQKRGGKGRIVASASAQKQSASGKAKWSKN